MYFAFGWPKVLAALEHGSRQEDVVYLYIDQDYFVLVSTSRIQLWTGGQHRVKLGTFTREVESLKTEGLNRKAYWSSSKRSLAVLTYNNVLHIYGMHSSKEAVLSTSSSLASPEERFELKRVDMYLQQSQLLSNGGTNASDMVGDSRALLLSFSDGSLQLFSWQAKLRANLTPFSPKETPRGEHQRTNPGPQKSSFGDRERASVDRRPPAPTYLKGSSLRSTGSSTLSRSSSIDRMSLNRQASSEEEKPLVGIECMDYSPRLHLIATVLSDGRCAVLRAGVNGLGPGEQIEFSHWLCGSNSGATSVRMSSAAQLVALGLANGEVALYRLWGSQGMEPLRVISLGEWGYEAEVTGSVSDLQWSPDSRALAVGWRRSGLGVWSPAGCRLMCTLRQSGTGQGGLRPQLSGGGPSQGWQGPQGLEVGISVLAWGVQGHRLMVAESGSVAQVMELILAKSLPNSHRVPQPEDAPLASRTSQELFFLLADDRLLQISDDALLSPGFSPDMGPSAAGVADLTVHHLKPPPQYVAANWPLQHAALSPDGVDVAVAGRRGLALYSRRSARWRLFGDVSHEKELVVHALLWLPRMVLVCATMAGSQSAANLLLFPRYHLDKGSILARFPLQQVPLAMDVLGAAVVVASPPLEIKVLRVNLTGELTPLGTPTASFQVVRELSIMFAGQPLQDIALVEVPAATQSASRPSSANSSSTPQHCVLLRAGGLLTMLDMERGSELTLSEDIECFWLSSPSESSSSAAAHDTRRLAAALDVSTSFDTTPSRGEILTNITGATPASSVSNSPPGGATPLSALPVGPTSEGKPPLDRRLPRQHSFPMEPDVIMARAESNRGTSTSGRGEVEIPWWTYGARGMQLWFPSSLAEPVSPSWEAKSSSLDPELEFDKEVYPVGISLAEVAIIGVTQRIARSSAVTCAGSSTFAHSRLPLFQVVPESQPVLPCLLRRLLQQGREQEAVTLASRHSGAPHFARSLEWLLFTSLEINAELMPSPSKGRASQTRPQAALPPQQGIPAGKTAGALLTAAADLLRHFSQFAEIVVNVARKTDAAMWGALFAAVGKPSGILEGLLEDGALQSAACCLVIVDKLEGSTTSYALCLRLIRVTVAEGQYELTADLLRFVVPPGDDNLLLGLPRPAPTNGHQSEHPSIATEGKSVPPPQRKGWLASLFGREERQAQPRPFPGHTFVNGQNEPSASKEEKELYPDGTQEDRTAWISAWRLVGHHAWRLLDQGRLRAAVRLGRALLEAGASLPSLLMACPEGAREGLPSPAACLSALHIAEREFPVASDQEAAHDALLLKEACQATYTYDWLIALALILDDTLLLAEVRQKQPELWGSFVQYAQADARSKPYRDIIAAIDALPGARLDVAQNLSPMPSVLQYNVQ